MHGLDCVFGVLMCQSCGFKKKTCGLHLANVVVIWAGFGPCMVLCWFALWVGAWVGSDVVLNAWA